MVALAYPKLSAWIRTCLANKRIREQHIAGVCTQGISFLRQTFMEYLVIETLSYSPKKLNKLKLIGVFLELAAKLYFKILA